MNIYNEVKAMAGKERKQNKPKKKNGGDYSFTPKKIIIFQYGCEEYDFVIEHLKKNYMNEGTPDKERTPKKELKSELFHIVKMFYKPVKYLHSNLPKEQDKKLPYPKKILYNLLTKSLEEEDIEYNICIALISLNIEGNKYGGCFETELKEQALKDEVKLDVSEQKHFFLSFTEPGELLRAKDISAVNYAMGGNLS